MPAASDAPAGQYRGSGQVTGPAGADQFMASAAMPVRDQLAAIQFRVIIPIGVSGADQPAAGSLLHPA